MQLRSLALPFTVLEWTLPTVPRPGQAGQPRQSVASEITAPPATSSPTKASSTESSEFVTFDLLTDSLVDISLSWLYDFNNRLIY